MQGERAPPLQAITGVAEGIFSITRRGRRSRCSCLSPFWMACRQHRSSRCHSIRTDILERTSIQGHADERVRPATTLMVITKRAQKSAEATGEQTAPVGACGGRTSRAALLCGLSICCAGVGEN
uniref:Uncharacterized protein n=1 Tax=Romanomermis culicivorax TaxID=13658 RepID=A0A915IIT3_ROMCU